MAEDNNKDPEEEQLQEVAESVITEGTITTPTGTITREEKTALEEQYPEGIPSTAVEEVIEERGYEIPSPREARIERQAEEEKAETREEAVTKAGITEARADVTPESVSTPGMQPYQVLVAMRDAGADTATLTKYINENPDAARGAEARQIAIGIGAKYADLADLKGEERIATARAMGVLPEGFDELPQELQEAYVISDKEYNTAVDVFNQRQLVEQQEAIAQFEAVNIRVTGGEWYNKEELTQLKEEDPG